MGVPGRPDEHVGDLEDILAAFMADYPQPSFEALCDYLHRHPRHARELIEFTVEWAVLGQAGAGLWRGRQQELDRMAQDALTQLHDLFSPLAHQTADEERDDRG
jgi:hypothetical protein